MPYKSEKIAINNEKLDRRVRLTQEDKKEIKRLHGIGITIRAIHRGFYKKVDRRTIQFVLFPDRLKKVNFSGHWKKYYDRKKNSVAIKQHRHYKNELYKKGLIG